VCIGAWTAEEGVTRNQKLRQGKRFKESNSRSSRILKELSWRGVLMARGGGGEGELPGD